jgi:hypothetical protein
MKVQLALLAQAASIDRFSNRLSIFNLVESFESPSFPLFVPEAVFVSVLRKEEGDPVVSDATLSVYAGESMIGQASVRVDFEGAAHTRQVINFQGLPLLKPVNLQFRLVVPDRLTHVLEIPVTLGKPMQPGAPA